MREGENRMKIIPEEEGMEARDKEVLAGEMSQEEWNEKTVINLYEETKKEMEANRPTKEELHHILEGVMPEEEIDEEVFDETVKKFREKKIAEGKYILFGK